MFRPEEHRLLRNFKEISKFGVRLEPEKLLGLCFCHVHGAQSRALDVQPSSTLSAKSSSVLVMKTMAERVQDLLDARQMEPMDLVRAMHVTKATVYFILAGTTGPDKVRAKTVLDMARHLRTTPDYILEGKGPRDLGPIDASLAELMQLYGDAAQAGRDALLNVAKALAQAHH